MNLNTLAVVVLLCFVVGILVAVYIYPDENTTIDQITSDLNGLKDDLNSKISDINTTNIATEIEAKKDTIYSDIEKRYLYGSADRNLDVQVIFCPEDDCSLKLVELINESKKSIDCSIYDVELSSISDALVDRNKLGVALRIVSDYEQASQKASKIGELKVGGANVIISPESYPIMHNKFCVFDNEIVWVGSMNFTLNDSRRNNNNVLIINDKEVADFYTNKIDYFFRGIFSPKINPSIETNKIGNGEFYFCPEDNCGAHVISMINDSNLSIECMFFSFTLDDAGDIMIQKNVAKRIVFENTQNSVYSEYDRLKEKGIPVLLDKNPQNMHNKFCVIDNKIVMTGSMNLSVNGTQKNDESLLFIYSESLAQEYLDYFNKYWNEWNL